MIDAVSRNKLPIAGLVGSAVLVYHWRSIKPMVVSVIGAKATAIVALVAAVVMVARAVLAGIGIRNWLMNKPQEHRKQLRARPQPTTPANPVAAHQAKAKTVAERAGAVSPLLITLQNKIKSHPCNHAEKQVLEPMFTELEACSIQVELLNVNPKDTFRSNNQYASAMSLVTTTLEEALQPSYDLVMDPESHKKIASNQFVEQIKADMKAIVAAAGLKEKQIEEFSADASTQKIKLVEA